MWRKRQQKRRKRGEDSRSCRDRVRLVEKAKERTAEEAEEDAEEEDGAGEEKWKNWNKIIERRKRCGRRRKEINKSVLDG